MTALLKAKFKGLLAALLNRGRRDCFCDPQSGSQNNEGLLNIAVNNPSLSNNYSMGPYALVPLYHKAVYNRALDDKGLYNRLLNNRGPI